MLSSWLEAMVRVLWHVVGSYLVKVGQDSACSSLDMRARRHCLDLRQASLRSAHRICVSCASRSVIEKMASDRTDPGQA